jgi:hypothetical protein
MFEEAEYSGGFKGKWGLGDPATTRSSKESSSILGEKKEFFI